MSATKLELAALQGVRRWWSQWIRVAPARAAVSILRLGRTALTNSHSIHVVEIDGRRYVIGCHAQGMTVLNAEPAAMNRSGMGVEQAGRE